MLGYSTISNFYSTLNKACLILCSELLLIATLLSIFERAANVVRGPSGPLQQILAAVLSFQARCKYCDTR